MTLAISSFLMFLSSTAVVITSAVVSIIQPRRAYLADLRQTKRHQREVEESTEDKRERELIRQRRKDVYRASRLVEKRIIEAMAQLGFRYAPRAWERNGRRRWQNPDLGTVIVGLDFCVFRIDKLPYRVKPSDLVKDETIFNIRQLSGRPDLDIVLTPYDGIFIYVPLKGSSAGIPNVVHWRSQTNLSWMKHMKPGAHYINAGMGFNRRIYTIDMRKDPHYLVAGSTGSGKSVFLNGAICTAALLNSPDDLKFAFVDMKRVELKRYNSLPHIWKEAVVDHNKVEGLFVDVRAMVDERYAEMERLGVTNIDQWNKKFPEKKMFRLWVVLDEMADFMLDREVGKAVTGLLERLSAISRATGVHLIMCTQRPSTDVITGLIKANASARLALNCTSAIDSRVIIDNGSAFGLKVQGRAILYSSGYHQVQVPLIEDQIDNVINEICNKWRVVDRPPDIDLMAAVLKAQRNILGLIDMFREKYEMSRMDVLELYDKWQYIPDKQSPVIWIGGESYAMWQGDLIPINGKNPPATVEEVEIARGLTNGFSSQ